MFFLHVMAVLLQSVGNAATPDPGNYKQLIMQAETIPKLIEDKVLTKFEIPNPHWRKDACLACHVGEPDGPAPPLKALADGSCFFCHSEVNHVDIHPVNLAPGKKMLARMPKAFKKNFLLLGVAAAGVGVAMMGAKKAFDFTREGAQLNQLEESFDLMNKQVFKIPGLLHMMIF